jgi:hypothetical protein
MVSGQKDLLNKIITLQSLLQQRYKFCKDGEELSDHEKGFNEAIKLALKEIEQIGVISDERKSLMYSIGYAVDYKCNEYRVIDKFDIITKKDFIKQAKAIAKEFHPVRFIYLEKDDKTVALYRNRKLSYDIEWNKPKVKNDTKNKKKVSSKKPKPKRELVKEDDKKVRSSSTKKRAKTNTRNKNKQKEIVSDDWFK